jgi:hypothetical protein
MGQVTIYIDDDTERKMMASAKAAQLSKSKWITSLIREKVDTEWPLSVIALSGVWDDFPAEDEIRFGRGKDIPREKL